MEVRLLGPVGLWHAGREVPLARSQRRCLVAVLAMTPGRPVPTATLIERIWGDDVPHRVRHSLYTHVSAVRRLLEGLTGDQPARLERLGGGYALAIEPASIDLHRSRQLAGQARATADPRALELLTAACALWRGTPLAGLTGDWADRVRAGLEQERLALLIERFTVELRLGGHAAALAPLSELVADHPLLEPLVGLQMLALYRCGRQEQALHVYARTRQRMVAELGDEPGGELRRLHQRILRREPGLAVAGAAPAAPDRPPAQLPPDVAAFTGREAECGRLDALLAEHPHAVLISALDGAAGVGKTALAVHWAHRVQDRFPDGQLYLNLRGYASAPPLPPIEAVARFLRALGLPYDQVPDELDEATAVYRSLAAGKQILFMLDNAASAEQVRPLLPGDPGSMVLVTSRERLDGLVASDGAHRLSLGMLSPAEARVLLTRVVGTDRAAAEPVAVAEIARLCGYLPLALRMAAANLAARPHRPIGDYLTRLREHDRLASLAVPGDPGRTVRAAFDLSYGRLPEPARRMFRLLGSVPGPDVTVAAAAALGATGVEEAARLLELLAGAHLVEEHAPGRYACHDLLHHYAAGLVGRDESEPALVRLYELYLRGTDAAARLLYPSIVRLPQPAGDAGFDSAASARRWLDAELDNLVAAIRDAGPALRRQVWHLADNLRGYFWLCTPTIWQPVAAAGLAAAEATGDLLGQAAGNLSLAHFHRWQGNLAEAVNLANRARALTRGTGWLTGEAAALNALGSIHLGAAELDRAHRAFAAALALAEQAGEQQIVLAVLGSLVVVDAQAGRHDRAARRARRALALSRRFGSRNSEAANLCNLGEIDRLRGRLDAAVDQLTESRAVYRAIGNTAGESQSLCNLAAAHRDAGRYPEAGEAASEALALAGRAGNRAREAEALAIRASILLQVGRSEEAAELSTDATAAARQAGARFEEAQALIVLAAACRQLGQPAPAAGHAEQALAIARAAGFGVTEGEALVELARLPPAAQPALRAAR